MWPTIGERSCTQTRAIFRPTKLKSKSELTTREAMKATNILISLSLLTLHVAQSFCVNAFPLSPRNPVRRQALQLDASTSSSSSSADTNQRRKSEGRPSTIPPVTLLSGFLGTGKTSLLKHLLENKDDRKIGVIVNDVASVNIDAQLISNQANDMIELQNGCACCSLSDELVTAVQKLSQGRSLDSIVVELSGVSDPAAIRFAWKQQSGMQLSTVVTLVDAMTFGSEYVTWDVAGERPAWETDNCNAHRMVSELLAEQVEAADVIVVNKVDIASAEQTKVVTSLVKALNEKAMIVQAEFGKIATGLVVDPTVNKGEEAKSEATHTSASAEKACSSHSHSHAHDEEHASNDCSTPDCDDPTHNHRPELTTEDLGITSFVYSATRPFNLDRLMSILDQWPIPIKDTIDLKVLQDPLANSYSDTKGKGGIPGWSPFVGVLRSKGFAWFAPDQWSAEDAFRHDTAMFWSNAGRQFGITAAGKWWASTTAANMKARLQGNEKEFERIRQSEFKTEEWGDRRQEIVFIGTNLKEEKIKQALNSCLYTEEEMDGYRKAVKKRMRSIYEEIAPSQ